MLPLKKRIWIFIVLIIFALVLWSSISLQEYFKEGINIISGFIIEHPILGISIFIGLAALSAMLSPFSSIPLLPSAILAWGDFPTFLFLLIGWLIGGTATYLIGKYAAYSLFKSLIPFSRIEQYRQKISTQSEFILVLLFRLMMPAEIPGYLLGMTRYNFIKYFIATLLAELPFALISIYASEALIDIKPVTFISLVIVCLVLISVAFHIFQKKKKICR